MKKYLILSVLCSFFILSGCEGKKENIEYDYYKDKNNVYIKYKPEGSFINYEYKKIENAESESFDVLNEDISKDKDNIFLMWGTIEGLDHDTFSVYGKSNYAKDKDNIYYLDFRNISNPVKVIEADRDSFEIVKGDLSIRGDAYARDKNKVFFNERVINNVDSKTIEFIDEFYFKDKDHVFVFKGRMKDADPDTFEVLEMGYAKDKNNIYYMDKKADVDIETFEFIKDFGCAKDKNNYYYHGKVVDKSRCQSLI